MKSLRWLAKLAFLISLLPIYTGCGAGQAAPRVALPIILSVSPNSATVQVSETQTFTATVISDPGKDSVAWSVSCSVAPCGTVSPTTTTSGVPTTFTAPSTTPLEGLNTRVIATSTTDKSKSAWADVSIPGVQVFVTPNSASLQAGGAQQFTATVSNDSTNSGVAWTLTQDGNPCSPACGTISPTSSASASPISYTAPSSPPPSDVAVAITATSVALSSATTSATVTVLALKVLISPISALLPGGTTQQFSASVISDPSHGGVTLALTQNGTACLPSDCGTLSSSTSPAAYNAPAQIPSAATAIISATSVSDTTKSASAPLSLTPGTLEIVPYSLDFGNVPKYQTSPPRTLTLTNTGTGALSITGVQLAGEYAAVFSIESNNCASSLAPLSSCTIDVTFTPDDWATYTAGLSITDSSVDSPQQVSLSGTGDDSGALRAELRSVLANSTRIVVPAPTGTSPVGTTVIDLVDSTRDDPYLSNGAKRELLVRFWYPASLSQGCIPAPYISAALRKVYSDLLETRLPEVQTNSCQDAPVADGVHPVVVFSPGLTATSTDYTFIFEDLASRGYVMASVDHTYEATAVEFPDGRVVRSVFGSYLGNARRAGRRSMRFAVSVRLQDLETVLSELERLNSDPGSRFAGRLDTTRIALAGHSLGGLTAILGVEREPRFVAAINIDGGVPRDLVTSTVAPVFILAAGRVWWSGNDRHLWNELHGQRFAVNLVGSEHATPSDAVWLAKGLVKSGAMGPDKTIAAIRSYIVAFLDTYVRGMPMDPLLVGRSSEFPDAVVTLQDQPLRDW